MSAPQSTRVQCPQCRQLVMANVMSVIDVGQQPQLKAAFLRGQINSIQCPSCGYRGMMATPMIYHDPAKQMALVLMPMELGLRREEEERTIGKLTNALVAGIPNEQKKMYMFQPRLMLSFQGMIEEIMAADGISKEMLNKQALQMRLLEDLLRSASNEETFKQAVQNNKAQLDQDFVNLVTTIAQETMADGDRENGTKLLTVATLVARELGLRAPGTISVDELLEAFQDAKTDEEFRELLITVKSALDYKFYQALTTKIEAASGDEAKALKQLRARLLAESEQLEQEAEAKFREGSTLLQLILQSDNPKQTIAENIERIDDSFLMVLQANIQQAMQQKQEEVAKVLQGFYQEIVGQLEDKMPPEVRQVNQLLRLPPGERAEVFRTNPDMVTLELLQTIAGLLQDVQMQGRNEIAQEMVGLMNQAAAWAPPQVAAALRRQQPASSVALN